MILMTNWLLHEKRMVGMQKYVVKTFGKLIDKVECERETKSSVWVNGSRNAKISEHRSFFDTFDEAKSHLIKIAELRLDAVMNKLAAERKFMGDIIRLSKEELQTACDIVGKR